MYSIPRTSPDATDAICMLQNIQANNNFSYLNQSITIVSRVRVSRCGPAAVAVVGRGC